MKRMVALILLSFNLSLLTHAETAKTLPIIEQPTQVMNFYQHKIVGVQITVLFDGTNFMSLTLVKDIL